MYSQNYYLYRLYNFNEKELKGDLYILKGAIQRKGLHPKTYLM